MKVSELEGAKLDYFVAKVLGMPVDEQDPKRPYALGVKTTDRGVVAFSPSTDWAIGGPLIGQHRIAIEFYGDFWGAEKRDEDGLLVPHPDPAEHAKMADGFCPVMATGDTPLIAAMRALVVSKFGDEVPI